MLHFIPAWYQQNTWHENEQKWYVRRMHTEFDDTVKQIQLFHRNKVYPYQLLLLSFSPNLRHFLHRQGVYHAPYWSCFDAIQEVRRTKAVLLSFHNMKWPAHTEFVYTPFVVTALLKGEKYAQIEFGEDGNPIQIDIYKNGILYRRNIYDDRGFVSATIIYRDGQPLYQDYLMENGVWKLRCFQDDGHVEVNPSCTGYRLVYGGREQIRTYSGLRYDSMEQVIREILSSYLELTDDADLFCAAMDEHHADLIKDVLRDKNVILSFFGNRYEYERYGVDKDIAAMADYIITDSYEASCRIRENSGGAVRRITDISPYDTRMDFGISQQLKVQKILVPVDGLEEEDFDKIIAILGRYLMKNENTRIHLFTRQAEYDRKDRLLEQVRISLRSAGLMEEWGKEEEHLGVSENHVDLRENIRARFLAEQCVDELSVSKCIREQRILLDMRKAPTLYLQIMAVSAGIPMIVGSKTQFVEHGGNGMVLRDIDELPAALEYYLDSLPNWNDAMVYSYEMGKKYTSEALINKWKEVIDCIGKDSDIANRP